MTSAIIVWTTTSNQEDADRIAQQLVEQRLAACVQIDGPITSWYRWQGKLETSREWRLSIKTRGELFDQLAHTLRSLHPYEQPEIVAVPITAGSQGYLKWIETET